MRCQEKDCYSKQLVHGCWAEFFIGISSEDFYFSKAMSSKFMLIHICQRKPLADLMDSKERVAVPYRINRSPRTMHFNVFSF